MYEQGEPKSLCEYLGAELRTRLAFMFFGSCEDKKEDRFTVSVSKLDFSEEEEVI